MALYYFILKNRWDSFPDTEGAEFDNESAAHSQAISVAQELMRNRELDTRLWRIEVRDENLQLCSEVFFSSIDPTIFPQCMGIAICGLIAVVAAAASSADIV